MEETLMIWGKLHFSSLISALIGIRNTIDLSDLKLKKIYRPQIRNDCFESDWRYKCHFQTQQSLGVNFSVNIYVGFSKKTFLTIASAATPTTPLVL